MTIEKLSDAELASEMAWLPGWTIDAPRRALYRRLSFSDFAEALSAMVRIGVAADKVDHHPEWSNVYNRVDIWLTTHDADGISARDLTLARTIDAMFPV